MNIEENKKLWAKIVAKAWCDEAFKAELVNNPEQVLKAEGAEIPEGVRVHVVEERKPSTAETGSFTTSVICATSPPVTGGMMLPVCTVLTRQACETSSIESVSVSCS